ncbi:uncharacterized protein MYCFIDRAFT_196862 [Pseudocercospora fijiensis CIRAD86]|uniref:F-box domain-containing protein n=1 Tax=Pseudocercospora fijiensis (strain CIRAD86) TaxID=383855 RepID=M2ZXE0_PSEFD|nr:uncharacterized protein MYCFIDRAFT_196862 [Pseudocercospora fijiensis CIRAD86]EME83654.1 hypothetical protein MYCFIDRAFT_196862 [Pseudocercospora fijiensis CIRAD86]
MSTHASRAFDVAELLSMILIYLTPKELKQAYRVNKTFKSTIDQDKLLRLRVHFFKKPLHLNQAFEDHQTSLYRYFGRFETILHPTLHQKISEAKQGCPNFFYAQAGRIWDLEATHNAKMYQIICQPHAPSVIVSFGKAPWATRWKEEVVFEEEKDMGVKLGQLVDAVKRLKVLWTQEVRVEMVQRGRDSVEYRQEMSEVLRKGGVMEF